VAGAGPLTAQTREIAAAYIAAGVDPSKAIIFPQSAATRPRRAGLDLPVRGAARLARPDDPVQGKKSGQHKERASVGLYTYPVLQAADILPLQGPPTCRWARTRKQHLS